jgi:hypothetical protein
MAVPQLFFVRNSGIDLVVCNIAELRRCRLKGIVQGKLRWVESGVTRWVMLRYYGAGHNFLILKGHHLVFRIKRFAAT